MDQTVISETLRGSRSTGSFKFERYRPRCQVGNRTCHETRALRSGYLGAEVEESLWKLHELKDAGGFRSELRS